MRGQLHSNPGLGRFSLTVPGTDDRLRRTGDVLEGDNGTLFPINDGIVDLTLPGEREKFDIFAADYGRFRQAEGRLPTSAEAVRALPYEDLGGELVEMWAERARSFDRFSDAIAAVPAGSMVDVGAGCGWLALRMLDRGWSAAAIDLNIDFGDGLGAARALEPELLLARAAMERLPFATDTVDLVVFNASLHYALDVGNVLDEAVRVLTPGGCLAILDSPVYVDPAAGQLMIEEFMACSLHTVAPAKLGGVGYVTEQDLSSFRSRHPTMGWSRTGEPTGLLGTARAVLGRRRAGREIAKRPLILATLPEPERERASR